MEVGFSSKPNKMTNEQFQLVLHNLGIAHEAYRRTLSVAEKEIQKRYGYDPCSVKNYAWINNYRNFSVGHRMTIDDVHDTMTTCINSHLDNQNQIK